MRGEGGREGVTGQRYAQQRLELTLAKALPGTGAWVVRQLSIRLMQDVLIELWMNGTRTQERRD